MNDACQVIGIDENTMKVEESRKRLETLQKSMESNQVRILGLQASVCECAAQVQEVADKFSWEVSLEEASSLDVTWEEASHIFIDLLGKSEEEVKELRSLACTPCRPS